MMGLKSKFKQIIMGFFVVLSMINVAKAQEELYLFNWSQYMDPEIIQAFEQRYNVKVIQNYFSSLGEMYARLQAGGDSQFDLIVPSNYYVPRLISAGLVQKIDQSKLPHFKNLLPQFANPEYDPNSQYSVAFQWGTTGIVYDTRIFPNPPQSWSLLFDPKVNANYPFAIQSDGNVMLGAACAYLGYGFNCRQVNQWVEAAKLMLSTRQRNNFSGFIEGTPVLQQLARGVNRVGISFNGDYLNAKNEDPQGFKHLAFMLPKEGSELWVDTMMIPRNAPHADLAHKFIDFLLEAKIGAQLSNWTFYSSPNKAALPFLDKALQVPPSQPTAEELKRVFYLPSLTGKDFAVFQQIWNEVRSR